MKTAKILTIWVLALGLLAYSAQSASASPMGTAFTYQGQLYDASYPANGKYDFAFKMYDTNVGGSEVGTDVNVADVNVIDGYFTVELDFGSDAFNGEVRWLEIGVRPGAFSDPCEYITLSPRQEITPAPYAIYAKTAMADAYTKLLIHADGTNGSTIFIDTSAAGNQITANGNAQIDTAQKKFGTASGLFDGTGDYLSLGDSSDWAFEDGNFTIDFWVRFNALPSVGGYTALWSQYDVTNTYALAFVKNDDGNFKIVFNAYSENIKAIASTYDTTLSTNTWYHFAFVRNGSNWTVYQDGISIGNEVSASTYPDSTGEFHIGAWGTENYFLNGWIDEFRISKGIARWTTNFTPPSRPYANSSSAFAINNGTGKAYYGGNVGIGTTEPGSYKLNVNGNMYATNYYGDGSNLTGIAVGDGTISQAKLKTATGEVSYLGSTAGGFSAQITYDLHYPGMGWATYIYLSITGGGGQNILLPGGEYGFYPQVSQSGGQWGCYARQRYITSSGEDWWIFLLLDKNAHEIVAVSAAPDHPSYGNGGDYTKNPHPFLDYDKTKHEIVLLDKETCQELRQESEQTGKSILTLVNEEYKQKTNKEEVYQPLHSGKFLTENGEQVKQMVQSIPSYIKVRKLEKLTEQDKQSKEVLRQQKMQKAEWDKQKKDQDKQRAINKLKALGLDEAELFALIEK